MFHRYFISPANNFHALSKLAKAALKGLSLNVEKKDVQTY
jgi:hypothetical protein